MKLNVKLALLIIIVLSFFLRFYKVTEDPPSLNWDEVSIGYNAYSILKTGKDEWGQFLPVHFKSYGEYKLPVQIYGSIPGITLFGLNPMGIRITPVIYGTLTILALYLLAKAMFDNEIFALSSAFLLAISPWHIQLTRASFESSFSLLWVILGLSLFLKGIISKKLYIVLSAFPFALAVYTYNSARVFTPLFILVLLIIFRRQLLNVKKYAIYFCLLFGVLMLPAVPFVLSGAGSARYKLVSVANDAGLIPRINENRGNSKLPGPLPKLIHNRVTYLAFYYSQNYLAHFTPDFLFINGAPHKQHHVQGVGQMYLFQLPLCLVGLFFLFKNKFKYRWVVINWILLGIIPVATTNDSIPHALRTLIVAPAYELICAYGAYIIGSKLNKKYLPISLLISTLIILISVGIYLNNFYNIYPKLYSRDWQYGNKQVAEYIQKNYDKYDLIVYSRTYGEPHMFTLFYLNYDPAKFQKNPNLVRFETFNWVRVLNFDKFYFPDLGDEGTRFSDIVNQNPRKRILFIGKPGDFPANQPIIYKVNFLNGNEAFDLTEVP